MLNFSSARTKGDRIIHKRREEENKLAFLEKHVRQNFLLGAVAQWEAESAKLIDKRQAINTQHTNKEQKEQELQARRQKLQVLLDKEEEIYKQEIDSMAETAEERRARLEARAQELREKRLQRRQEFCEQQYLKQFRQQCDELRLNKGKNLLMECDRIRRQQIAEKELEKEFHKGEDDKYLELWSDELKAKIAREEKEKKQQQALNEKTAEELRQQIHEKHQQDEYERQQKLRERNERVEALRQAQEQAKIQAQIDAEKKQLAREAARKEYLDAAHRREAEFQHERDLDKEFLDMTLQREKADADRHLEKQAELRDDINAYLQYLDDLRRAEMRQEKELEKIREKELNKAWHKRELVWQKEKLARDKLLSTVFAQRQDQIALKHAQKDRVAQKDTGEREKLEAELAQEKVEEEMKHTRKLVDNRKNQEFLLQQILAREEERKKDKENLLAFDVDAAKNQVRYDQLLNKQMAEDEKAIREGKTTHHYPRQSANWWTL